MKGMFEIKRYLSIFLVILVCVSACSPKDIINKQGQEEGELIINENNSTFRFVAENSENLLPICKTSQSVADFMRIVYEPLFDFDEALNSIPVLAERCSKLSPKEYDVILKQGILWQDGTDFNANDVVFTVNNLKNSENMYANDVKKIKNISILNKHSVRITLTEPTANFVGLLSFPIVKRDTSLETTHDFVPNGTGAYKFSEKRNNTYYFTANEKWHGGEASKKTVTLTLLKDKQSAIYAFEANEADVITDNLMDLTKHTPRGNVTVQKYLSNNLTFLGMNNSDGILSDPEIRRAISYLIDKNTIINRNLYGRGTAVDIPIYPKAWFRDADGDTIEVMAGENYLESLLNQSGWYKENGTYTKDFDRYKSELSLSILVNRDNSEKMSIAHSIAQMLGENGIEVKIKALPYEQYNGKIRTHDFSMFIGEISMDKNMDPSKLVKSGENYFVYQSEAMDDILSRMGMAENNDELVQIYSEFSKLFLQDSPFVPLFFREQALIVSSELAGYAMPNYYTPYKNIENWYFSKKVELNR